MRNIGLVLVQSSPRLAHDPLTAGICHGLEETFVRSGMHLVTRVVRDRSAELDVYRYWHASGAVDAVVLIMPLHRSERVTFLKQLKITFVAIIDATETGDFSAVTIDGASMMRTALQYLTTSGYSDIAYVKTSENAAISDIRASMFLKESGSTEFRGRVVSAERTVEDASTLTQKLMSVRDDRPDAIIYEDDVTAAAGLAAIQSLGISVPDEVAVMAWNDSVRCQSANPPITAFSDQSHRIGTLAAECLIESMETGTPTTTRALDAFIVRRLSA